MSAAPAPSGNDSATRVPARAPGPPVLFGLLGIVLVGVSAGLFLVDPGRTGHAAGWLAATLGLFVALGYLKVVRERAAGPRYRRRLLLRIVVIISGLAAAGLLAGHSWSLARWLAS